MRRAGLNFSKWLHVQYVKSCKFKLRMRVDKCIEFTVMCKSRITYTESV